MSTAWGRRAVAPSPPDAQCPAAVAPDGSDGLPAAQRLRAMVTLSIAMGTSVLAATIAGIALPAIAADLAATPAEAVWVVNAYQLAVTVLLLPFASLGDIHGHRPVYLFGLAVFTLGSLACGLADSMPVLVGARVVEGVGAAAVTAVNMALVRHITPPARLGAGMGVIGLVVAAAATGGPSLAAAILAVAPWPWLFLVNVPLGLLALVLALRSLPATPGAGHRFDLAGAALNAAGFGLVFVGADGMTRRDGLGRSAAALAAGVLVMTAFVRRQISVTAPMLPVDLLRLRPFAAAVATSVCAYACQTVVFLALPFYLMVAGGRSQAETGLLMTPWPAALVVVAPLAGRLSDRHPAGLLCGVGLTALTAGALLLLRAPPGAPWAEVAGLMLLCGVGFGLFQSPNNRAFMASAPRERSGACAGMMTTSRLTGQTVGGLTLAMAFALAGPGGAGVEQGATVAMGVGAGMAAVAVGISVWRLRSG